jgi:SAM-dependent methyltransferase
MPTITVTNLPELQDILQRTAPHAAAEAAASTSSTARSPQQEHEEKYKHLLGWPLRVAKGEVLDAAAPGAPAPGLDFVDFLVEQGALQMATCSFPKMGEAAGGLQACLVGGEKVLHLGCGDGALSKMLASKGLQVVGVDGCVAAAEKRGLKCVQLQGGRVSSGALAAVRGAAGEGGFDAVIVYAPTASSSSSDTTAVGGGLPQDATAAFTSSSSTSSRMSLTAQDCLATEALAEMKCVLRPGGRLCLEVAWQGNEVADAAAVQQQLKTAGWGLRAWDWKKVGESPRLRLVAEIL